MPKVVDREQRRAEIADAVFRVVREHGLPSVTLARVADEADLAVGSVRHFAGTYDDLVELALDASVQRTVVRLERGAQQIAALTDDADDDARLDAVVDLLAELLPLDDARRLESVVWLEFQVAARTHRALRATAQASSEALATLARRVLERSAGRGALRADLDVAGESLRLLALLEGLTLESTLHPELLSPEQARETLRSHLADLRTAR